MGSLSLDVFLSQVFLSLESFLQKATTLNIFESLLFNYKIKVDSAEKCSPQVTAVVVDLCNELQTTLRDNLVRSSEWKELPATDTTAEFCNLQPVNPIFPDVNSTTNTPDKNESWPHPQPEPESSLNLMSNEDITPSVCGQEMLPSTLTPTENKPSGLVLSKFQLKCDQCNRKFRTNAILKNHLCKTAVQDAQPLISDCDESSQCVDDPTIEYSNVTDLRDLPVFVCSICFATYSEHRQFEQHVCKESDSSGNEKPTLVLSQKHLENMRSFVCGICCETYRSLGRIMYHVVRCRTGPYLCELCSHAFSSRHELNRHKKKNHKGVECFFCGECGLGFQLRTSLQKHQVNRHESEQGKYTCDIESCDAIFTKRIYLTNHKLEDHGVERKYLCQVCGNKFLTKTSLTCHLETHTDKNKHQCPVCTKVLCTKEKLTFHVRTHTGERPFVCETCSKSFISKAKLFEHMRRHRGEKPHKCGICNKTYANKIDLTYHLKKVHSPENTTEDASTSDVAVPMEYTDTLRVSTPADSSAAVSVYPSRMLVQLDNGGSAFPLHPTVGLHLVDPASQYYQTEPLQLVRTLPVSMPTQNLVLGYEAISY